MTRNSVRLFVKDDGGYLTWLAANPSGFVINTAKDPVARDLTLHRATCTRVNSPNIKNATTTGSIKVCSLDVDALAAWAYEQTGGTLDPCHACNPRRPSPRAGGPEPGPASIEQASPVPRSKAVSGSGHDPRVLRLPSGLAITGAEARLLRFCQEEYDYYDGIADSDPNRIVPIDVLATVSMNLFINDATGVRKVHRALAARCDPLLDQIPVDADLGSFDPSLQVFGRLLHEAIQAPGILVPVATKVLHRKRRGFIPMLDNVVIGHYLKASDRMASQPRTQDKRSAASIAVEVLKDFRADLRHCIQEIADLQSHLGEVGFTLTPVRILEVLVWTETEGKGYYR